MIRFAHGLGAALLAALAAGPASAGVVLKGQIANLKEDTTSQITMLVDASRLRINTQGGEMDSSMILLIDGDDYQMIMLDNRRKEYRVMDRETIAEMDKKVSSAMAQMEEQFKKMTPEQRAMMEKMMGKKLGQMMGGGAPEPPPMTYRETGSGAVHGRACKKYDVLRGDEKVSELCAASPQSLELGSQEMALLDRMRVVFEDMTKSLRQLPGAGRFQVNFGGKHIDGFPIEQVMYTDGQPVSRFEFQDAARRSLSDADFSTGDAKKVEMPLSPPAR
jgi:hypothetical protein